MRIAILIVLLGYCIHSGAQSLPVPKNIIAAYNKGTRSKDGKPGKNYWHNTADYTLDIDFNPVDRMLNGLANITYYNNSNDTLKQIVFHLNANLYKKGVARNMKIDPQDAGEGISVDSLSYNNRSISGKKLQINGTIMTVSVDAIAPKSTGKFSIKYHYQLNKTSHIRTGEIEPNAFFIAYFFPRIAVYDDIDGWNRFAYNGQQEFYNDFCNFKATVRVPENFIVWATGNLTNASAVLQPDYVNRIKAASLSDKTIDIIDSSDLANKNITQKNKQLNWQFEAENVTDFVFAVSDHYLWKACSVEVDRKTKRRTQVNVAFSATHKDFYEVIDFAAKTVEGMSHYFPKWPFPFPHITVIDGLDQMEYPMMVNDNPLEDRTETITLTDHEIFHMMFPFYMGTNETKYGWMDEGWATIGEWLITKYIDSTINDDYGVAGYEMAAGNEIDLPITTLTTHLSGRTSFINNYPKPAMGYLFVKDLLGDSLFTAALHHYIKTWNGKHPMPYDFFYCMNEGSGKNLNWFWKKWFFENGEPDLAIRSAKKTKTGYTVVIESVGGKPVPVDLHCIFADGTKSVIHKTIEVWEKGNATISIQINTQKIIQELQLGSLYTPDSNKKDNVLKLK